MMTGQVHRLIIYLKSNDELFLVAEAFGDDKEALLLEGQERSSNNPEYVVILLDYNISDVTLISRT